jgi:hypothetical protein
VLRSLPFDIVTSQPVSYSFLFQDIVVALQHIIKGFVNTLKLFCIKSELIFKNHPCVAFEDSHEECKM